MGFFDGLADTAFDLLKNTAGKQLKSVGVGLLGDLISGGTKETVGAISGAIKKSTGVDLPKIIESGKDLKKQIKKEEIEELRAYQKNNADIIKLQIDQNIKLAEIDQRDRASARTREVDVVKATGKRDYNLYALGWSIFVAALGVVFLLAYVEIPEGNKEVFYMCVGAVIASLTSVVNYFFGSSKGSNDKTSLLKK